MENQIGFIGQGFVGKNLADNFEARGFRVVRYSLETEYIKNKEAIQACRWVFIAVPTPSTPDGFDYSIVDDALKLCAPTATVVIKSTIPAPVLKKLNKDFEGVLLHCPEFLDENTAKYDTDNPLKNIVGSDGSAEADLSARQILRVLPGAEYNNICNYDEASLIKYLHNASFFVKNIFWNMAYDVAEEVGADYDVIIEGILSDPRITKVHTEAEHKGGRGAGGHCLIKDFAVFSAMYTKMFPEDENGNNFLLGCEKSNIKRLIDSDKDVEILKKVYDVKE